MNINNCALDFIRYDEQLNQYGHVQRMKETIMKNVKMVSAW